MCWNRFIVCPSGFYLWPMHNWMLVSLLETVCVFVFMFFLFCFFTLNTRAQLQFLFCGDFLGIFLKYARWNFFQNALLVTSFCSQKCIKISQCINGKKIWRCSRSHLSSSQGKKELMMYVFVIIISCIC